MLTQDGRRILIGWMQSWDANITPASFQWSGMMTIPRELTLEHGRIYQKPVRELEKYRTDMVRYDNLSITGSTILKNITGRVLELLVEITGFDFEYFRIQFAKSDEYQTFLQYNHKKRCLTIDRTHSGIDRDVVCRRKMELAPIQEENSKEVLKLRILLDKYSVEVFANDGEKVMSSLFYTPLEAESIVFDSDGTACINIIKYSFGNLQ